MNLALGLFFVLGLIVTARVITAHSQVCPELSSVQISSSTSEAGPQIMVKVFNSTIREIHNHSLSQECSPDFAKCNMLMILDRFLFIPATGHLVILDLSSTTSPLKVVPMNAPACNPVNIFFDDTQPYSQNTLWVTCRAAEETLWQLAFSVALTSAGQVQLVKQPSRSRRVPYRVTNFSKTLLISDVSCPGHNKLQLYTVVEIYGSNYVLYFPILPHGNSQFHFINEPLVNCEEVLFLGHEKRNAIFTVHCPSVSMTVNTCDGRLESHSFGVSFLCPRGELVFTPETITSPLPSSSPVNHTLGEIVYGRCQEGFFVAVTANGSVNVLRFGTRDITTVAESVCVQENGSEQQLCVYPSFSANSSSSFLVYDVAQSVLKLVHILPNCVTTELYPQSPAQRPLEVLITGVAGSHDCQCQDQGTVGPGSGAVTVMTAMEENPTTEITTTQITIMETATTETASTEITTTVNIGRVNRLNLHKVVTPTTGIILVVVVTIVVLGIFVSFLVKKRCRSRSRRRSPQDPSCHQTMFITGNRCANDSFDGSEESQAEEDSKDPPPPPTNSDAAFPTSAQETQSEGRSEWCSVPPVAIKSVESAPSGGGELLFFPGAASPPLMEHSSSLSGAPPDTHEGPSYQPAEYAEGNGHGSVLVSQDLLVQSHRIPPTNLKEKAIEQNSENRQNELTEKTWCMNQHHRQN